MIGIHGGEERTEEEYRLLLGKAGFTLTRVAPTESAVSVVEAVPGGRKHHHETITKISKLTKFREGQP